MGGKTPIERTCERSEVTLLHHEVAELYDPSRERIRHRDYRKDQKLAALHAAGVLPPMLQEANP